MGLLDSLKELISKEETPPVAPVVPVATETPPVVPVAVTAPPPVPPPPPAPVPEPQPAPAVVVATAAETIIPPAGVVNASQTTGGTVYDRLDRGEKVTAKEINEAWDDPESGLQARLLKAGR